MNKPSTQAVRVVPVKASKRTMNPEGKARLVAALKARWAGKKKAEGPAQTEADKSGSAAAKESSKATTKAVVGPAKKGAQQESDFATLKRAQGAEGAGFSEIHLLP